MFFLQSGLPHTQGTQGIQGNSGNFQVEENLRKTKRNSGNFDLIYKLRETQGSFKIIKISRKFFARFRMRLINLVQYFVQEN